MQIKQAEQKPPLFVCCKQVIGIYQNRVYVWIWRKSVFSASKQYGFLLMTCRIFSSLKSKIFTAFILDHVIS